MKTRNPDRLIRGEVVVEASLDEAWDAWTTTEGIKTFFAPDCNVELRVDGPYEMVFDLRAEPGQKGGEGAKILAVQPKVMLAFTWNAPPHMPNVRKQYTHVVIRFKEYEAGRTVVSLTHDGWGEGEEWDEAYDYFIRAWNEVVLPRLRYRFSIGPVDWDHPPELSPVQAKSNQGGIHETLSTCLARDRSVALSLRPQLRGLWATLVCRTHGAVSRYALP